MNHGRLDMSDQKREILRAIDTFGEDHGYQPNVRELGSILGLSSSSTIHAHLTNLREMGLVDWVDGQVRTLHLTSLAGELEKAA